MIFIFFWLCFCKKDIFCWILSFFDKNRKSWFFVVFFTFRGGWGGLKRRFLVIFRQIPWNPWFLACFMPFLTVFQEMVIFGRFSHLFSARIGHFSTFFGLFFKKTRFLGFFGFFRVFSPFLAIFTKIDPFSVVTTSDMSFRGDYLGQNLFVVTTSIR